MPQYIDREKIKLNSLSWIDGDGDILVPLVEVKKAIAQTPTENVIELPCKVGDTVYRFDDWVCNSDCEECNDYDAGWYDCPSECGKTRTARKHPECIKIVEETITFRSILSYVSWGDFGKRVFLTREEAEKVLAERRENEKEKV